MTTSNTELSNAYDNYLEFTLMANYDSRGIGPNHKKPFKKVAKKAAKIIANKNYREWFPKGEKITRLSVDKFSNDLLELYKNSVDNVQNT